MRSITTVALFVAVVLGTVGAGTVVAQDAAGDVSQYYIVTVKPGAGPQFESAFKGYTEWRKAHGDTWTWNVAVAVNGDALGQ